MTRQPSLFFRMVDFCPADSASLLTVIVGHLVPIRRIIPQPEAARETPWALAMRKTKLTVKLLQKEAAAFAHVESTFPEPTLYGVNNGKAIGTYLEHKFRAHLEIKYAF